MASNQPLRADDQSRNHPSNLICDNVKQSCVYTRVDLLAVNPASAYHVRGLVNGVFMLDTGASVSLIREDVWREVVGENAPLTNCNLHLVGIEGSTIAIFGVATLETLFASVSVKGDFIVAKTLSTEAIIGLDFLE